LSACIAEVEPLRYTPAGLPALNVKLEHESQLLDSGHSRTVKLVLKAVAFGTLAERLGKQAIGSHWKFSGFLSNSRQGKSVVLNIQDFLQD
jgi:primosomal replication protein N